MKRLFVAVLVILSACAKIHLECPTSGMETATVGGSTVGYSLIAMGAGAAKSGGLMAAPGAPASGGSTVDYSYVPIFGQDMVSCGNTPAVPTPAPTPLPVQR